MPVGLDEFPELLRTTVKTLRSMRSKTTTRGEVYDELRHLHETWIRDIAPRLTAELGDTPDLLAVGEDVDYARQMVGTRIDLRELRATLNRVAKSLDTTVLPAYQASRWSRAAAPVAEQAPTSEHPDQIAERLGRLNEALRDSYVQAMRDMENPERTSYLGPAGEIREVMRATVQFLIEDENLIKDEPWFTGHEGRPTQAERIRFVLQRGRGREHRSAESAAELVEVKVGELGRGLYQRASRAFHAGSQRDEVERIALYARAFLLDVLPDGDSE